ncbi:hypothetical protein [Poriferisphaera corsica]|uniref:hypothetical protein n=1 Tax=Poriferisphaera corsica TaxID=2528020 RepID=UPI0011A8AFA7|nr:hypothetical protein [Poriferisphaera corsica]
MKNHPKFGSYYATIQRQPSWVTKIAIFAFVFAVVIPIAVLVLAAILVATIVFTILALIARAFNGLANILTPPSPSPPHTNDDNQPHTSQSPHASTDYSSNRPSSSPPPPPPHDADGRRNVRVIRRD